MYILRYVYVTLTQCMIKVVQLHPSSLRSARYANSNAHRVEFRKRIEVVCYEVFKSVNRPTVGPSSRPFQPLQTPQFIALVSALVLKQFQPQMIDE